MSLTLLLVVVTAWAAAPVPPEAPPAPTALPAPVSDSVPAWFRRHLEGLAIGSGRWIADNSANKSEGEPFDAYGLEWTWGLGRMTVKGRLYAIRDDKEIGSLFEYRIAWHFGERRAVLIQYGSDGTIGEGVLLPDGPDGTSLEQTFHEPDGSQRRIKHTDRLDGDVREVQSFDWVDGAWQARRQYRWKRVA